MFDNFTTALPDGTRTRLARVFDELGDVIKEGREALADGVVTVGEVFEIGVEVGQLGAALVGLVLGDAGTRSGQADREERRRVRGADREARKIERRDESLSVLPFGVFRVVPMKHPGANADYVARLVSDDGKRYEEVIIDGGVLLKGPDATRRQLEERTKQARRTLARDQHPSSAELTAPD